MFDQKTYFWFCNFFSLISTCPIFLTTLSLDVSKRKRTHGSPTVFSSHYSLSLQKSQRRLFFFLLGGCSTPQPPGTRRSCLDELSNADLPTRHPSADPRPVRSQELRRRGRTRLQRALLGRDRTVEVPLHLLAAAAAAMPTVSIGRDRLFADLGRTYSKFDFLSSSPKSQLPPNPSSPPSATDIPSPELLFFLLRVTFACWVGVGAVLESCAGGRCGVRGRPIARFACPVRWLQIIFVWC